MSWQYKRKKFSDPGGYYGFIYKIIDDQGKWYIGKKAFTHKKKTKLSIKARIGTRKRFNISYKDSGWQDYWSSCIPLQDYIKNKGNTLGFQKIILKLCKDRASLSYWEVHYLCENKAIFDGNSWNSNVSGKFFRGRIHE